MSTDTPTESLVNLPAHDACEPARVLQRQADDLAFCAPETLAAKLRAIGYREPVLPVPRQCVVDGCSNMTHLLICQDCEMEIEASAQAEENRRAALAFWPALAAAVILLAFLFAGCWKLGQWLRGLM